VTGKPGGTPAGVPRKQDGLVTIRRAVPAAGRVVRGLAGALADSDPAPRWRSPAQRWAAYAGLAAATLLACVVSLASREPGQIFGPPGMLPAVGSDVPSALVALGVVVPLPLLVRYPLLGWRIGWLLLLLTPLAGLFWWGQLPWGPVQLVVLVALFSAAAVRHERPVCWWMWALTLLPWWLWLRLGPIGGPEYWLTAAVVGTAAFTAVAVAADAVGGRGRAQRALASQAKLAELERGRRAALEERARIARELHDVVAHHMSLIAVQAETAPYRLTGLTGPVAAEFGSLSGAAREALADMRRLLGVLRDERPAARAPQPRLPDLPALVEAAQRAGVAVELSAPDRLGPVPTGVEVCAYRIVQESLTNARRHAPGAAVTVSLAQRGGALVLRVANGPAGPLPDDHGPLGSEEPPGSEELPDGEGLVNGDGLGLVNGDGLGLVYGHGLAHGRSPEQELGRWPGGQGLTGMRERVALLGGSLSAGPSPDGGFVVSAVLPAGEPA
jgi:signal transduction histidine kinase